MNKHIEVDPNTHKHSPWLNINNYLEFFSHIDIFIAFIIYIARQTRIPKVLDIMTLINKNHIKDSIINKTLNLLREASNADRVVIGLFHNTSIYGFNYHVLKMTVFHESLKYPELSLKKVIKEIPLSYLADELVLYKNTNNSNRLLFNIKDPSIKSGCRIHLNNINVSTIVNYLLVYNNTPVGILSFQFQTEQSYLSILEFESFINNNLYKTIDYHVDILVKNIIK
jgi:hypothetical protein